MGARDVRLRKRLLQLWGNRCFYCGERFSCVRPATIEHLTPRCFGGAGRTLDNLALAHERCNSIRGNASLIVALQVFDRYPSKGKRARALHVHRRAADLLLRDMRSRGAI